MAVLKCHQCGYTKGIAEQYAGKSVKCPQCEQPAKVYDTALLLTAYSKKVVEMQSELKEVKQVMAEYQTQVVQPAPQQPAVEEQVLNKLFRENRIAMTEFNDATKLRNNMMQRSEKANYHLMRFSIVGFLIILVLISFLMIQMVNRTDEVSSQLASIGVGIQTTTQELQDIKNLMSSLENGGNDASSQVDMEALNKEVERLNKKLQTLSDKYNSLYYRYR